MLTMYVANMRISEPEGNLLTQLYETGTKTDYEHLVGTSSTP